MTYQQFAVVLASLKMLSDLERQRAAAIAAGLSPDDRRTFADELRSNSNVWKEGVTKCEQTLSQLNTQMDAIEHALSTVGTPNTHS